MLMDPYTGGLLQSISKFSSDVSCSFDTNTNLLPRPKKSSAPQIEPLTFEHLSETCPCPRSKKIRKYKKIAQEMLNMMAGQRMELKEKLTRDPEVDKKFEVAPLTNEQYEFLIQEYAAALTSQNPAYAFVVDYFMQPSNPSDETYLRRMDQLSPEHFMGIVEQGPAAIPVILFGVVHSQQTGLTGFEKQQMLICFLTNIFNYCSNVGLPIFQTWQGIDVIALLRTIRNPDNGICLIKEFYIDSKVAADTLEYILKNGQLNLNDSRGGVVDLRKKLWRQCVAEEKNLCDFYALCEQIKVACRKSSSLFSKITFDLPGLKYFFIANSHSPLDTRYLELLVDLEEGLLAQENILASDKRGASDHKLYLQTHPKNPYETFLKKALAINVEVSPYTLKVLRGWIHNLPFLEKTSASLLPTIPEKERELSQRNLLDPMLCDFSIFTEGISSYQNHLHLLLIYMRALVNCREPAKEMIFKKIEEQIAASRELLYGAMFGVTAKSFFQYLQAKYGTLSVLDQIFSVDQAEIESRSSVNNEQDSLIESAKAGEILRRTLAARIPSPEVISTPRRILPAAKTIASSVADSAPIVETKLIQSTWEQLYQQIAEVMLPLFKFDSFCYAMNLALKGDFKQHTPKLKVEMERSLNVLFKSYQTCRASSAEEAKAALFYFFTNELPSPCVKLFLLKNASQDAIRMEFNAIILRAAKTVPVENGKFNEIILNAFVHQLAKTIKWKKEHVALFQNEEEEERGKEILALISFKNSSDSLTIMPTFFDFSAAFSLRGFREDRHQTAASFLMSIFSEPLQCQADGRFDLTEKQFEEFYKYLERNGPTYYRGDKRKEFLLISRGKVIDQRKIELEKPLVVDEKLDENEKECEPVTIKKHKEASKASLVWSLPSLKTQKTFADSQNPFDEYLRLDGLKVVDGLWRKKNRQRIFRASQKVDRVHTNLSVFLNQSSAQIDPELSFCFSGLKAYQKEAVQFLVKLKAMRLHGGLLGLDTGLGKTPTVIEFCAQLFKQLSAPVFYTGTKSTVLQSEDSFRSFMGKMILEELGQYFKLFKMEHINGGLNLAKIECYYVIFSAFKQTLENAQKNIPTRRCKAEILEQRQNQKKLIEEFLQDSSQLFEEFKIGAEKHVNLATFSYEKLLESYQGRLPQGLWDFNIFEDIIGADAWEKLTENIAKKKKIVVVTLEILAKHAQRVIESAPQSFIVDEAHAIDNPDTLAFQNFESITTSLQKRNQPAFIVFASATLFEHRVSNLLAYLKLITPHFELAEATQGVIPIADLALIIPKRLNDLANSISKLCMNKKMIKEEALVMLYKEIKSLFAQMEAFKKSLSTVSIRVKKNDPAIRDQWQGRIPIPVNVEHQMELNGQQTIRLDEIHREFTSTTEMGKFFAYYRRTYKTLFYPNILEPQNKENKTILDNLDKMSIGEIIEWAKPAPMLTYFLTDPGFEAASKEGALIYVDETLKGKILQKCLAKRFGVKVPYLTGEVSNLKRRTMAQNFEKPLDGKPRLFLSNSEAGAAGMDFRLVGLHVYFTFYDFDPKKKEQSENRICRVNSDKEKVYVHTFRFGIPLERTLDWHSEKKNASENYYFNQLRPDFSNLYELFEDMIHLMHFEIPVSKYSEDLAAKIKSLQHWIMEFAREDDKFATCIASPQVVSQSQELKRKAICLENEKGKEKVGDYKRVKGSLKASDEKEKGRDPLEEHTEKALLPHEKGKEKVGRGIKRARADEKPISEAKSKESPLKQRKLAAEPSIPVRPSQPIPTFQGEDAKYELMSNFLTSFESFSGLDLPRSQFFIQKDERTTLGFTILPMRQRDPGRKDNYARTVFAGYMLSLLEDSSQQTLVNEFRQAEAKDAKLYLTARVSSTFLKREHPELGQRLWEELQFPFKGSDQENDWTGFTEKVMIEIYTPDGRLEIQGTASNDTEQPKPVIRLLRLGTHFDLLHLVTV
ncbi:MAG: hypothetical protein CK425_00595 [Parachlamydia sp.]|nr:MAG: hypothetical protein CK425_00595 [Parachlamydia sp.]